MQELSKQCLLTLFTFALLLGPFLHSHFGASHVTGIHIAGMHAVHANGKPAAAVASKTESSQHQAIEDESPALGVVDSLPQPPVKVSGLFDVVLAYALLVLPLAAVSPIRRTWCEPAPTTPIFRPGLPPPALAPPSA